MDDIQSLCDALNRQAYSIEQQAAAIMKLASAVSQIVDDGDDELEPMNYIDGSPIADSSANA